MENKTMHIKMVTPWGTVLMYKELKDWKDVDVNEFMNLHYMVVRTSKEDYKKAYKYYLISQTEMNELKQIKTKNHKETLTIKLSGNNTVQHINVNFIFTIKSSFIDINKYLHENEESILIRNESNNNTTIIDLTNVTPYVLLFFDDDLYFKGASYSIKSGNGSYTIKTEYKNILFVRIPHSLKLNSINKLNI